MSRRPSDPSDLRPGNEPDTARPARTAARPPHPPVAPRRQPAAGALERQPGPGGGGDKPVGLVAVAALGAVGRLRAASPAAFLVSTLRQLRVVEERLTYSEFIKAVDQRRGEEHRVQQVDRRRSTAPHRATVNGNDEFTARDRRTTSPTAMLQAAQRAEVDAQVRRRQAAASSTHPAVGAAAVLIFGLFVWLSRPRTGADGRGHEHRAQPGQGLQHREAEDHVRRRRRLRRR